MAIARLLLFLASALSYAVSSTELQTLRTLYIELDGENWRNNDGWGDPDTCFCDWYGIKCNPGCDASVADCDCHVIEIDLSFNDLSGQMANVEFNTFRWLSRLYLSGNNLNGFDSEVLPPILDTLDLSFNNFTAIEVSEPLLRLKRLSVSGNPLDKKSLEGLFERRHFPALELLDASQVPLNGPIITFTLTTLKTLRMRSSNITGVLSLNTSAETLEWIDLSENILGGRFPTNFSEFRKLVALTLSNAGLSVPALTLPDNLLTLNLNGNPELGNVFGEWGPNMSLSVLKLSNCGLRAIDDSVWRLPSLSNFDISYNSIDRVPDNLNLTLLKELFISYNKNLNTSDLNKILASAPNLLILDFSGNNLNASLEDIFVEGLEGIRSLDLSNNMIYGDLPSSFLSTRDLVYVSLRNNSISGVIVDDDRESVIISLDLSNNPLRMSIDKMNQFLSSVGGTFIQEVNFGNCQLSGEIDRGMFYTYEDLSVLDLSGNPDLGGVLPLFPPSAPLRGLFLQGTSVEGDLPIEYNNLYELEQINLKGTRVRSLRGPELPEFIRFDFERWDWSDEDENMLCPSMLGRSTEFIFTADPSYHEYSNCICIDGYLRPLSGSRCVKCPRGCDCKRGTVMNCYPYPSLEDFEYLIPCPSNEEEEEEEEEGGEEGSTVCLLEVPGTEHPWKNEFSCGGEQAGRVCSQCNPGYFKFNNRCTKCQAFQTYSILAGIILMYVVLGFVLLHIPTSGMTLAQLIAEVAQSLKTLSASSSGGNSDTNILVSVYVIAATLDFDVLRCLGDFWDYYTIFYLKVSMPIIFFIATLIIYYVGLRFLKKDRKGLDQAALQETLLISTTESDSANSDVSDDVKLKAVDTSGDSISTSGAEDSAESNNDAVKTAGSLMKLVRPLGKSRVYLTKLNERKSTVKNMLANQMEHVLSYWRSYTLYIFAWFLNITYFPLIDTVFGNLGCSREREDFQFLNVFPEIDCSPENTRYQVSFVVSWVVLVLFIAGIPVFFTVVVKKALKMRDETEKKILLGFCTSMMKPKYKYWYLVSFAFRILVASFTSFVPSYSLVKYILLFFLLEINLFLVHRHLPFHSTLHNIMKIAGDYVVLLTYVSSIFLEVLPDTSYATTRFILSIVRSNAENVFYIIVLAGFLYFEIYHEYKHKGKKVIDRLSVNFLFFRR